MTGVTDPTGPTDLTDLISRADAALVRTVDGLADAAYAEPSLLPGWTRAHVVAHLTLNAEALAGVLHGAHLGQPQPMYASPEQRDADIAELGTTAPAELRERFLAATGAFTRASAAMGGSDWEGRFDRTPGAQSYALTNVPLMRIRELEIHHADLDAGYTHGDWSGDFSAVLLDSLTKFEHPTPLDVRPADLDRTWHYGPAGDGPVVSGTASALGWWLTGRGTGDGVTSDSGPLPEMESW